MASSIVGWYGPLINLSEAKLHIGDFVQLLVFVHNSNPLQYKSWRQGDFVRRDIRVGDETRPHFPVSIWPNQIGPSMPVPGDVILLQNVKISQYGSALEGKTVHCSSMLPLIHPYQSLLSKGSDELVAECRVGIVAKEKLRKVIEWVKQSGSGFCNAQSFGDSFARNWKLPEEIKSKECLSLSGVLALTESCEALFFASVGEIFMPFVSTDIVESDKKRVFLSRRLYKTGESMSTLVTDLICTGCRLCGSPLNLDQKSMFERDATPLYCSESSNRLHVVSFIYRPFMLYVWDESEHMPILVKNKAAELLFGNIKAEQVYSSFRSQQTNTSPDFNRVCNNGNSDISGSCSLSAKNKSSGSKQKQTLTNNVNFYLIWLILLRALLQQGKNSPLKFTVNVNTGLNRDYNRFQLVSVCMPCFGTKDT